MNGLCIYYCSDQLTNQYVHCMLAFQMDGFIARNWTSQASKLGSFLDPMADKLLVGALVISLSYCSLFPVWLCAMIIFRDVFLIIAGFVIRYISLPPPVSATLAMASHSLPISAMS